MTSAHIEVTSLHQPLSSFLDGLDQTNMTSHHEKLMPLHRLPSSIIDQRKVTSHHLMMMSAIKSSLLVPKHAEHLNLVLSTLMRHQLFTKFSKCEFWKQEVDLLGHVISAQGVSLNPSKFEVVMTWKQPSNVF